MSEQAASTAVAGEARPATHRRAGAAGAEMPAGAGAPDGAGAPVCAEVLVEEELLVEEVSIDGMCGVY
jgi:mycofactocin precursor